VPLEVNGGVQMLFLLLSEDSQPTNIKNIDEQGKLKIITPASNVLLLYFYDPLTHDGRYAAVLYAVTNYISCAIPICL